MEYTNEFKEAVTFAENENLFLGYGNPNGKVLMIGKECSFDHNHKEDTDSFYEEIIQVRNNNNKKNTGSWLKNIEEKFTPNWVSDLASNLQDDNPFTAWWNQRNIINRRLKNGAWNGGTSTTYTYYQKIYQNVFLNGNKEERINFQKEFFITELNDFPSKKSFNLPRLNELRIDSIRSRMDLLNKSFFRSFPVVIIASGHYPRDHNFDIEKTFKVDYIGNTTKVGNSWYNLHHSKDDKRLVIHTRQLSNGVTNDLVNAISNEVKSFLLKL